MSDVTFPLSKPIKAHGEDITSLTLKKPDGQDIINFGLPMFARRDDSDPQNPIVNEGLDMGVVAKYVAKCASIPPSAVRQIDPVDWPDLGGIVAGFFMKQVPPTNS